MTSYDTGGHEGRAALGQRKALRKKKKANNTTLQSPKSALEFQSRSMKFLVLAFYGCWYPSLLTYWPECQHQNTLFFTVHIRWSCGCLQVLQFCFVACSTCRSGPRLPSNPLITHTHTPSSDTEGLPRPGEVPTGSQPRSQHVLADRCQAWFLCRQHFSISSQVPCGFCLHPPAQTDWSSAGPMEKVWTIAGITRRPTKRGISSRQQHIVTGETELAVRGGRY